MRRVTAIYGDVLRTYLDRAPSLILLAAIVFLPLGVVHSLTVSINVNRLDLPGILEVLPTLTAIAALTIAGLLGTVFYTGAVSISLTHPEGERPPGLREIADMIAYRRLLAIDLLYGLLVTVGLILLVAPGLAAFVYLALAAPLVEIEGLGVRAALSRSFRLVRGSFWVVAAVLIPIELLGNAVTRLAIEIADGLFGDSFLAGWAADFLANLAFTPFLAVAAVLLTMHLVRRSEAGAATRAAPVRA